MTLLQALHALGYDSPRWVSPSGRVVFTDPGDAGSSITKHSFHGGADVLEHPSTRDWWTNGGELARDVEAMASAFPSFRIATEADRPPVWEGTIDTGYGLFEIRIEHRFDHGLPRIIPIKPSRRGASRGGRFMRSPHLFDSGTLCVAEPSDWDPARDTSATVVAWAAHWHACYVMWFISGIWPSDGVTENE
ncbi:hypothetical protein DEI96_017700 [Curtobacterium sp. MCLR17_031]|uniref:hypothetical protein n=1 Tax=unclassified Curtobacterium TaxID=257496 RepID=UPI0011B5D3F0|nr:MULTISPECIES: hypothetical protein [unclassified Curtobacterium]WIE57964.1 hypothetical protein DEI96_017700 [Curtobacterium sp. MCLR17_031]